ncbi:nucleoside deaminase [Candidatus Nitrospira salsa]
MNQDTITSFSTFTLQLPDWLPEYLINIPAYFSTIDQKMTFVTELARLNVKYRTGGPFAAAVFDSITNRLVAPGVNLVTTSHVSIAHAEIVALTLAQHAVGHHDLGAEGHSPHELVTSTEPCAMCLGAIPWSGIRTLICGARDEDARDIGFDEGTKPPNWVNTLHARGIVVTQDIHRHKAIQVLQDYAKDGGSIYNGRQSTP